jgi:hypothetical protein
VTPAVSCPFCACTDVELVSQWGGQLITSQVRCQACNSHFEALRADLDPGRPASAPGDDGAGRGHP